MAEYIMFREIWTPFRLVGIRVFQDEHMKYWYKIGTNHRKRVFK